MSSRWIRLTAIVAEREIRQRGRSRAFLVSTIVLLLVVVAGVAIPAILAHNAKPQRVGVVGGHLAAMSEIVREAGRLTGTGVTVVPQPSLAAAEAALRSGGLDVVLANDSEVVVKQVSVADSSGSGGGLASAIADVAGLSKLVGQLPPGAADRGVTLPVRGLTPPSASLSRRLTGLFTVVLVWVLISAYGSQIAMGVGEEKQNRIVEVILASVRPLQLLVGKVTGIGILALAQAALMVAAFLGVGAAVGSSLVHGAAPGIVITGAVFLILGYAFYCTAYAAAGSLVSRQSDVGAVILPVQVPLIIAYALSYTVIYADGANVFYRVLGFLPPTAPIARLPAAHGADRHARAVRRGRRARLAGGGLRRPGGGGHGVDGAHRGDHLRAVHPAHRLPGPAASGANPPRSRLIYSGRVDRQRWDDRYSSAEFEWSMHPNQFVAEQLAGLPPGRALDLAAGEGRNSVWLAERGWSVTAVDFSRVGLEKGRKLSAAHGVPDGQVNWVVADLGEYQPARAAFDLVLIAYLQVGADLRGRVLAGAAAALVPGGTLLVVGHDLTNLTEGVGGPTSPDVLYTPEAITAGLPALRILRAERVRRTVERDGGQATAIDTLVRAERPAG